MPDSIQEQEQHNPEPAAMRLLLVVDHALFRVGLKELLERRGVEVMAAMADWQEGIELAVQDRPDAMLLDLLLDWVEDDITRMRILEDNPVELYGFE